MHEKWMKRNKSHTYLNTSNKEIISMSIRSRYSISIEKQFIILLWAQISVFLELMFFFFLLFHFSSFLNAALTVNGCLFCQTTYIHITSYSHPLIYSCFTHSIVYDWTKRNCHTFSHRHFCCILSFTLTISQIYK